MDEDSHEPEEWSDGETIEVSISALAQYTYCQRRCSLIHVEQSFDENIYTIRGRMLHERVDSGETGVTRGVRMLRAVTLWSERHGLRGKSDLVELRPEGPYPVEYKSGKRHGPEADVQLCAQALCLEEMTGQPVPRGAIYSLTDRRRYEVVLDAALREKTMAAIAGVRALLRDQVLPAAPNDARCKNCSLVHSCLPAVIAEPARVRGWQSILYRPLPLAGEPDASEDDGA